jgi:hypothetical protein
MHKHGSEPAAGGSRRSINGETQKALVLVTDPRSRRHPGLEKPNTSSLTVDGPTSKATPTSKQVVRPITKVAAAAQASKSVNPSGEDVSDGATPPPAAPPARPDLGPNLLAAYNVVATAGCWLESLAAEYGEILAGVGKASSLSFSTKLLDVMEDGFHDGDGWVFNGWRWTYPCRYHGQRIGTLSFIVDLGKPGRPAHALGQPCAIVAWSGMAYDWSPVIGNAGAFWPPSQTATRLIGKRLIEWSATASSNATRSATAFRTGSWFYLVPLMSLDSNDKLRSHIVQPALALLNGEAIEAAFATAPDVLQFDRRKGELVITR